MSRYFTRLFGNPSTFGIDVDLFHPEPSREVEFDFLHWGGLKLWVKGRNLAASSGPQEEFSDSIDWEIAPLLGWLVKNWQAILHEEKLPIPDAGPDGASAISEFWRAQDMGHSGGISGLDKRSRIHKWWMRHSIQSASEGGLFPNVVFRRFADDIEVSWDSRDTMPGSNMTFVEDHGAAILSLGEVHGVLHSFLSDTAKALLTENPSDPEIGAIASAIPSLTDKVRRNEGILWLSGLKDTPADTGDVSFLSTEGDFDNGVIKHSTVTLLFRSSSPEITLEDVGEIQRLLATHRAGGDDNPQFRELVKKKTLDPGMPAYRQGYDLAREFRQGLGLNDSDPFDSEPVLKELGIGVMETKLTDWTLRALSFRGPEHSPTIAINQNTTFFGHKHAREMDYAHELCHLLYDQEYGRPMGIVSGPWAPANLEKRANAFAAYLRLPSGGIRDIVGRDPPVSIDRSTLLRMMEKYQVGITTATYQLLNLGWISDWERQELIDLFNEN